MEKSYTYYRYLYVTRVCFWALILCLITGSSFARPRSVQELMSKKVSIAAYNETLKSVLSRLEIETQVRFTYTASLVRNKSVTVDVKDRRLDLLLNDILEPLRIGYHVSEDFVILQKMADNEYSSYSPPTREIGRLEKEFHHVGDQSVDRKISGVVRDEKGE